MLNQMKKVKEQPEAWVCPVCGHLNARYLAQCWVCGPPVKRP